MRMVPACSSRVEPSIEVESDDGTRAKALPGTMSGVSRTRLPSTVRELEERLAGAAGPSEDDQSRTADGEMLDTREAVERFLETVEQFRSSRHPA